MSRFRSARSRAAMLMVTGAVLAATAVASLAPTQAVAPRNREAPLISGQPKYDNTDLYAFVSPDRPDTTTLIANWIPFEDPAGGPNFYKFATDARYDVNIDTDGEGGADLNFRQTYDLQLVRRKGGVFQSSTTLLTNVPVAPSNVGRASMPDYATLRNQAVRSVPGGGKVFAGQADDPFFLDLRVFDLLYGGNLSEVGDDTLRGYNVNTVAIQVPSKLLRSNDEQPIVGVWTTTSRGSALSDFRQVSRLGMPLVNEVVIPRKDKDKFNASVPWKDAQFGRYVTNPELPRLIQSVYGIPAPAEPRNDLVQVFLTGVPGLNQPPKVRPAEMLRLNTSIAPSASPKRLGVLDGDTAGFPNGRRLTDDVVDISLQVVEGELLGKKNDLGDAVDGNDTPFGSAFPYVALPHSGSDVQSAAASKGSTPPGGATPPQGGTTQGAGQQGGATRGNGTATAGAGRQGSTARDGATQLNADNAASRASSDRLPLPVAAAIAAAMVATAAGGILLGRRLGRRGSSFA